MSTLTLAPNRIIEVALAKAREMKVKPLSVAVLDAATARELIFRFPQLSRDIMLRLASRLRTVRLIG